MVNNKNKQLTKTADYYRQLSIVKLFLSNYVCKYNKWCVENKLNCLINDFYMKWTVRQATESGTTFKWDWRG